MEQPIESDLRIVENQESLAKAAQELEEEDKKSMEELCRSDCECKNSK